MSIEWRLAQKNDRQAIQQFKCAIPDTAPKRRGVFEHPSMWEFEVQQKIRKLSPPNNPWEPILIGKDSSKIAAICRFGLDSAKSREIWVGLIAVHNDYKGQGIGGKLLDKVIVESQELQKKFVNADKLVIADVHINNLPSQRLFESRNFRQNKSSNPDYFIYSKDI